MAADAKKKAGKKRKGSSGKKGSKKSKQNDGESNLKDAIDKHNVNVGTQPIFIQPNNLTAGCVLKDYQLEGVRWLTSLFENGISGILAESQKF